MHRTTRSIAVHTRIRNQIQQYLWVVVGIDHLLARKALRDGPPYARPRSDHTQNKRQVLNNGYIQKLRNQISFNAVVYFTLPGIHTYIHTSRILSHRQKQQCPHTFFKPLRCCLHHSAPELSARTNVPFSPPPNPTALP